MTDTVVTEWRPFVVCLATPFRRGTTGALTRCLLTTGGLTYACLVLDLHLQAACLGVLAAISALALIPGPAYQAGFREGIQAGRALGRASICGPGIEHRKWIDRRYAALPPAVPGKGYLYAVEFSTGVVKVGQTTDPRARLGAHRSHADAYGVAVANFWLSAAHRDYILSETRLIKECRKLGSRERREYFHGIEFAPIVALGIQAVGR